MGLSKISCFPSKNYLDITNFGELKFSSPVVLKLWEACKIPNVIAVSHTVPTKPLRSRKQYFLKFLMTSCVLYWLSLPFKF